MLLQSLRSSRQESAAFWPMVALAQIFPSLRKGGQRLARREITESSPEVWVDAVHRRLEPPAFWVRDGTRLHPADGLRVPEERVRSSFSEAPYIATHPRHATLASYAGIRRCRVIMAATRRGNWASAQLAGGS